MLIRVATAQRSTSSDGSSRRAFITLGIGVCISFFRKVRHPTDETTPSPSLFTFRRKLRLDASAVEVKVCTAEFVAFEACQAPLSSTGRVGDHVLGMVEGCDDMLTKDDGAEVLVGKAELKEGLVV